MDVLLAWERPRMRRIVCFFFNWCKNNACVYQRQDNYFSWPNGSNKGRWRLLKIRDIQPGVYSRQAFIQDQAFMHSLKVIRKAYIVHKSYRKSSYILHFVIIL